MKCRRATVCASLVLMSVLCACGPSVSSPPSTPKEQELTLTLGGFIAGGPTDQKVEGICGLDPAHTTLQCDIYNGLRDWRITEVTVQVVWSPYEAAQVRLFRQRVAIAPLTTAKVNIHLGVQLPPDSQYSSRTGRLPAVRHWSWLVSGARAIHVPESPNSP